MNLTVEEAPPKSASPVARIAPPSLPADPAQNPQLRRDLTVSVGDGAAFGVMVGIGETYVPAFVLAIGMGEVFAGLIASVPLLIGSLLQLVSPFAVRALKSHRRWVITCAAVQGACFIPLTWAALSGSISATWAMVITSIYWGAGLGTGPAWNTWQGTVVPRNLRATFYARRARLQQIMTLVGFLIAGVSLQYGRNTGTVVTVFAALFTVAAICRALSTMFLWLQSEPQPLPPGHRTLSVGEVWHRFTTPTTGRLLVLAVVMQAGVYVSGPFFNPYMLKVLNFSYTEYAILLGISFVAKFLTLPLWGRVAHRLGAMPLLWIGTIGIIPLAGGWNVSSNYWYLLGLQVFAGTAWGAYELALILLFFETIPERERTSVLTWYNLANSVALVAGSAIGAGVLKLGNVTPEAYHWVYAVSTVVRCFALLFLMRLPRLDVTAAETPLRPLSLEPSSGSFDSPVLPGLPDQAQRRDSSVMQVVPPRAKSA